MTPILVATGLALPNSSCKVRQNTATTTNGVGKIRPARGRSLTAKGPPQRRAFSYRSNRNALNRKPLATDQRPCRKLRSPICRRSCHPGSADETILTLRYATPVEG